MLGQAKSGSVHHPKPAYAQARISLMLAALSMLLAACQPDLEAAAPQARPVRTVTIAKSEAGQPVTLTGRIEAEDEVTLGFRVPGRLLENGMRVGDRLHGRADDRPARAAKRDEHAARRAGQSRRRAGAADASAESFRPPGHAAAARLDDARQFTIRPKRSCRRRARRSTPRKRRPKRRTTRSVSPSSWPMRPASSPRWGRGPARSCRPDR